MNFYEHQARARQQTRWLVVLFVIALIAVVLAVNVVVLAALSLSAPDWHALPNGAWLSAHPGTIATTSLAVLAVVCLASLYKSAVLRGGGGAVARSLGGTRIERDMADAVRQRLHNVVEEMAIASGVPMPEIYVLEQESGINAFAAGHTPSNAAITVTRGALERLNRSELQGVIAHEFSHILNGDMRLNVRLIGLLFGLLVVTLIGRTVLRHMSFRSRDRKGGIALIAAAALAIMVLGYIGMLFGRIIQAAVSRGRERLADASAVQFTREPQGLKGALVKIGAATEGSHLQSVSREEVAHMLFAEGMQRRLFATHPPLLERIQALDPRFDTAEFARVQLSLQGDLGEPITDADSGARPRRTLEELEAVTLAVAPQHVAQLVGNPGTHEVRVAQVVSRSLPDELLHDLQSPGRAVGLLLALVLDPKPEVRERQFAIVRETIGERALPLVTHAEAAADKLEPFQRLPMLQQLFPALRRLPRENRQRILASLERLVMVDGRLEIFEYALGTLARLYLQDELTPVGRGGSLRLDAVTNDLQVVFSVLARHGADDDMQARRNYEGGMCRIYPQERPAYAFPPNWAAALTAALARVDQLLPVAKEQVVEGLVSTVAVDDRLTLAEAELLRTICASIHCPLPPLLGGEIRPPRAAMRGQAT